MLAEISFDANRFTAESFWSELEAVYRHQFIHYYERPWVLGIAKAGGPVPLEAPAEGPLAAVVEPALGMLAQLLQSGRELGVIRSDLPDDLLQALLMAVDVAHDRWLHDHWADMTPRDLGAAAKRVADALRRLLEPRESTGAT